MELRYHEVARARAIYERYIRCLPGVKAYVRYAKVRAGGWAGGGGGLGDTAVPRPAPRRPPPDAFSRPIKCIDPLSSR